MQLLRQIFVVYLSTLVTGFIPSPAGAQDTSYHLVWCEEFNGKGSPSKKDWNFESGFMRNHELQWYQNDNAFMEDGNLVIEARRERFKNPSYKEGSTEWWASRQEVNYTSSCLTTQGKHEFMYGRFELRARIDISSGMWPAWWTLGVDSSWPSNGEIDMMEYYRGMLLANFATGTNKKWTAKWFSNRFNVDSLGKNWSDSFHIWAMDWTPEYLALYCDDSLLNAVPLDSLVNRDGTGFNPFRQKHYILLNLAIGGDNGGDPSKTSFPRRFEIDWLRVYQRRPGSK